MTDLTTHTIDLARHADRVIAEMMRDLAAKRERILPAIERALHESKDGAPRAQQRMAERIRKAGVLRVGLTTGKRGKYRMLIHDLVGWDPAIDEEISINDHNPHKPWLAYITTLIERRKATSIVLLFVTHHALSRAAQLFPEDAAAHGRSDADDLPRNGKRGRHKLRHTTSRSPSVAAGHRHYRRLATAREAKSFSCRDILNGHKRTYRAPEQQP